MKLLVIGSGGREHALAWKLARSPRISRVFVAPGNAGTAREDGLANVAAASIPELIELREAGSDRVHRGRPGGAACRRHRGRVPGGGAEDLRPGPGRRPSRELQGIRQELHAAPRHTDARLTRRSARPRPAHEYMDRQGAPIVIKADGLAAGKGVVVAMSAAEAHAAVDRMLTEKKMGAAGARVVIEEFLEGEEASFIVLADGRHALRARDQPGPQAAARRRPRAQHRRHGRVFAGAGGHPRDPRQGDARSDPAGARRHGEGRHALQRFSLCRPDDYTGRAGQGAGIQLPHGRSRDAADHHAVEERSRPS